MGKEERNVATIKDAVLAMKLAEAANKSALKGDFVEIDY